MKRIFIINPNAGRGKALRVWNEISQILKERNIAFDYHMTKGPREAVEAVQNLDREYEQIIALGGDGTLHEVVNGISGKQAALGIIPAGTGNDFARLFDVGFDPQKEVDRILRNETILVDLVKMSDRVFINVAGMGFDATVAMDTNESKTLKKLGAIGYIVSVFQNLPKFKPSHVKLEIDGVLHEFEDSYLIAVANAVSYGGGMKIVPNADCQDGLLDVCVVSGISKTELIRVFPQIFSGRHITHPAVTVIRGKKAKIETKEPFIIHADGEITGTTPETFEIIPQAIRLLI